MDLAALGEFDFVISHGVYSWVPEDVQVAILSACQKLLAPNGIAYLSYNVYPGWKAKEIVRDAMLLRGGDTGTPEHRLSYARGMIDFLEEIAPADSVLAKAISDYRAQTLHAKDYYVLHEHLEPFNLPCYFLKLVSRANEHGLAYLADTAPNTMFAVNYGDKIAQPLLAECGHSQVLVEQYLDFFVNRAFRQSLFVRAERASQIRYQLDRKQLERLHFAASIPANSQATELDDSNQEYGESGATLVTNEPAVKAALHALNARWPWTLSRVELQDAVAQRLGAAGVASAENQNERIDDLLEHLIMRGQVRFRLDPVLPEPAATPIQLDEPARRLAELTRGDADAYTFNPWHEELTLSAVDRHLLPLLDGTRDRDALVNEILAAARKGLIQFQFDGRQLTGDTELRDAAAEHVDTLPARLVAMKLLRIGRHTAQ
jgi:methyltransferase-like protein